MASTFGPRRPWAAKLPDTSNWDPRQDKWELFDTRRNFSPMSDLAAEKLQEERSAFKRSPNDDWSNLGRPDG